MLFIGRKQFVELPQLPLFLRNALGKTINHRGMRFPDYKRFFIAATAGNAPFDYQCRLACGERDDQLDDQWLASGAPIVSRLITIPTGCGKTAAATLAWLWNRLVLNDSNWPRRLV